MRTLILCGGRGSRLAADLGIDFIAKPLLEINNERLIDRLLNQLEANGIKDVTVALSGSTNESYVEASWKVAEHLGGRVRIIWDKECKFDVFMEGHPFWQFYQDFDMILLGDVYMDDSVMKEIIDEPFRRIMYVRRNLIKPETFAIKLDDEGKKILSAVPDPFIHRISPLDPTFKCKMKFTYLLWYFKEGTIKKFVPQGYISDIDGRKEYLRVMNHREINEDDI